MKKQLLLGSALLAAIGAYSQQAVTKEKVNSFNMAAYLSEKFERQLNPVEPSQAAAKTTPQTAPVQGPQMDLSQSQKSSSAILAPANWNAFTGSMNIYGNLVSYSRPLNYNDNVQAVSFIHRKANDYIPNPFPSQSGAQSGAIVGMITDNWGNEWDTTLLWNHEDYWGRYPQGGIYAPVGETSIKDGNTYIIATGPITAVAGGWVGSFFASKRVDSLGGAGNNDTVSTGINDHQFIANSGALPIGKVDFPRLDFTATDDGVVRVLGILANNVNGTTNAAYGFMGASMVQGTFISGTFSWMVDSFIPDVMINGAGSQYVLGSPHMAWNESGTVGYVWFIGVRNPRPGMGDTLNNMGYQPIVFKTTNSGASWTELPRIDFNTTSGAYDDVFSTLLATNTNSNLAIPFFTPGEGQDGIVDRNDRLHIVSTVVGTFSGHPDSLGYTFIINNWDGEQYRWGHRAGWRPTLFDFTETPTGWMVTTIDSMSTEAPGTAAGDDGYNDNPWDATGGTSGTDKVDADARIQLSRTPDGRYIVYTFAESDTGFTTLGHKWNSLPNVKARMAEIGVESGTTAAAVVVHPTEVNVTKPASTSLPPYTSHPQVADRAVMHYVSPKCAVISNTASSGVAIGLPVTVSNNSFVPMKQLNPVTHYYLSANLNFDNVSSVDWPVISTTQTVNSVASADKLDANTKLFPNPSSGNALLGISLENASDLDLTVMNSVGQVVRTISVKAQSGRNVIDLNTAGLESGIYLVNIKTGEATATKKLLIQH
jgi:hypothetical protein